MSIEVRPPEDRDFFNWLGVYAGYAELCDTSLTDEKALLVWSWLTDADFEENALLAIDDEGKLVGLAHFHQYTKPIAGSRGVMLDDIFVDEDSRGKGAGKALVSAVRAYAAERGLSTVRWMGDDEDDAAQKLYGSDSTRTPLVAYDLAV